MKRTLLFMIVISPMALLLGYRFQVDSAHERAACLQTDSDVAATSSEVSPAEPEYVFIWKRVGRDWNVAASIGSSGAEPASQWHLWCSRGTPPQASADSIRVSVEQGLQTWCIVVVKPASSGVPTG